MDKVLFATLIAAGVPVEQAIELASKGAAASTPTATSLIETGTSGLSPASPSVTLKGLPGLAHAINSAGGRASVVVQRPNSGSEPREMVMEILHNHFIAPSDVVKQEVREQQDAKTKKMVKRFLLRTNLVVGTAADFIGGNARNAGQLGSRFFPAMELSRTHAVVRLYSEEPFLPGQTASANGFFSSTRVAPRTEILDAPLTAPKEVSDIIGEILEKEYKRSINKLSKDGKLSAAEILERVVDTTRGDETQQGGTPAHPTDRMRIADDGGEGGTPINEDGAIPTERPHADAGEAADAAKKHTAKKAAGKASDDE